MAMSESAAAAAIFAKLDAAQDYGAAPPDAKVQAQAQLHTIADAFAKCIPHMQSSGTVSTNDTCSVTGAVPAPPSAGVVAGSGAGTVGGLVKGSAAAASGLAGAILAELKAGTTYLPGADAARADAQLGVIADACAEFATYVMAQATVTTNVVGVA